MGKTLIITTSYSLFSKIVHKIMYYWTEIHIFYLKKKVLNFQSLISSHLLGDQLLTDRLVSLHTCIYSMSAASSLARYLLSFSDKHTTVWIHVWSSTWPLLNNSIHLEGALQGGSRELSSDPMHQNCFITWWTLSYNQKLNCNFYVIRLCLSK